MAASKKSVKTATPETIVQLNLGLDPVELSPEMKQIEQGGYAFGKANFCGKPVHYAGELSNLTSKRFVAIGLSEGAKPAAINVAMRAAASIAGRGFAHLIMGGTRKGDMEVIREHVANGGKVVVVLPMGLKHYGERFITDEIRQHVANGVLTLVSQFAPSHVWDLEIAKLRNILISKAAGSLFVADCGGEKGVWGLAECFKSAGKAIYVPKIAEGSRMEHYGLVGAMGAIQLKAEPVELSDGEVTDIYKTLTRKI